MMHPKMLRRILTVAREKLTSDEQYGFFMYFRYLKKKNEKAPRREKRTLEELLLLALVEYLPQRWRFTRKPQSYGV